AVARPLRVPSVGLGEGRTTVRELASARPGCDLRGFTGAARRVCGGVDSGRGGFAGAGGGVQSSHRRVSRARRTERAKPPALAHLHLARSGWGHGFGRYAASGGVVAHRRRSERFSHVAPWANGRFPRTEPPSPMEWAYSSSQEVVPRGVNSAQRATRHATARD